MYLKIKGLIAKKNMSQKEVSNCLGIDSSQFSKIVTGKLQPTLSQVMDISSFFSVSMDWLCDMDILKGENNVVSEPEGFYGLNYKEMYDDSRYTIEVQKKYIIKLEEEIKGLTGNNKRNAG